MKVDFIKPVDHPVFTIGHVVHAGFDADVQFWIATLVIQPSCCHQAHCAVESILRAAEVTFGVVVLHVCDEAITDTGVFDGNTYLSITCADCGSFSCETTCSVPILPFVGPNHWLVRL